MTSDKEGKRFPVFSKKEWVNTAEYGQHFFVFYDGAVFEITAFLSLHPGGSKALYEYKNKDITKALFNVYPHS